MNEVSVLPQPIGTVYYVMVDPDGKLEKKYNPKSSIGVIDIGFRTTDLARMENLVYIGKASESFTGLGVIDICSAFRQALIELGVDYAVALSEAEMIPYLKGNPVKVKGKEVKVQEVKDRAIELIGEGIIAAIVTKWPDWKRLDYILISGGGAALAGEYLRRKFGEENSLILDQWGNVNGYLRFGVRIWG